MWTPEEVIRLYLTARYGAKLEDARELIRELAKNGYAITAIAKVKAPPSWKPRPSC